MAGVEWVYEPHALPVDEPQLLEADSDRAATFDGKAQTLEGRDHGPPSDECVYYGDEDIDESLVDPVAAFETFAGHIFSSRRNITIILAAPTTTWMNRTRSGFGRRMQLALVSSVMQQPVQRERFWNPARNG
jgi:hypothetical protein